MKNITVSTEILEITGDCEAGLNVNAILQSDFSEVECSEIGRYALTLPLSGEDGNKIILLSSEDLAGNKIEITLEIVLDTISPTVSLQQINGSCSEKPIPTIFDNNNQPLCVLGAIAKYSGDDIVEWSIIAYYEGIEYDRKEGVFIENGKEITLEISDTSNLGSWTFTAWVVDEAGNFYETSNSLNLTSDDYTGLQHATKIGSSLNLIIIVLVIFILFTLVLIRKRENIEIETYEDSLLINPDMMFEGDDLSLKELETENKIPESELINSEELYNPNETIDELVIEQNHETSADIESIQELLDSNIDAIEMAESFANDTGIMLAAEGTIQGQSGWYHDRQGDLVYWRVDENGTWTRIDTEMN